MSTKSTSLVFISLEAAGTRPWATVYYLLDNIRLREIQYSPNNLILTNSYIPDNSHNCYSYNCMLPRNDSIVWIVRTKISHIFCANCPGSTVQVEVNFRNNFIVFYHLLFLSRVNTHEVAIYAWIAHNSPSKFQSHFKKPCPNLLAPCLVD